MNEILPASENLNWYVSRTCDGGACIQVASHGDLVVFGNTTQPDGPVYTYTKAEWIDFLVGVKLGDFDGVILLRPHACTMGMSLGHQLPKSSSSRVLLPRDNRATA